MARYIGPQCRLCRREGMKLFLKGARCESAKCAVSRREFPPGERRFRRRKQSDYGTQLREKQRMKRIFGIMERQFRLYVAEAERLPGNSGVNLLQLLERRLDHVLYMMGFATSHKQARQYIRHEHVHLNGRRETIPSRLVKPGDTVAIAGNDAFKNRVKDDLDVSKSRPMPGWIEVDAQKLSGNIVRLPSRDEFPYEANEQLIIEFCSR